MSNSDDIVVVLEGGAGAAADDAVIVGVNDAFCRASGHSHNQLLDRPVTDLFPVTDEAERLMKAIRGEGTLRSELACGRTGGGTFMLGMHLMRAPARASGRDCFVILGRDITAVLQARQMQESIQRLLAKVFSSVDAAVVIVNGAGRILMTNPHVDQLLGYKPNGLVGRNAIDLVGPSARDTVAANHQAADQGRQQCHLFRAAAADGRGAGGRADHLGDRGSRATRSSSASSRCDRKRQAGP